MAKQSSNPAVGLSPPWYTLLGKFKLTFGCDPAVTVGDFEYPNESQMDHMGIPITVDDKKKGTALRTLIRTNFPMGKIVVSTDVKNKKEERWPAKIIANTEDLEEAIIDAYTGNPLFVETKRRIFPPAFSQVGLIMTKTVVQFFNDDLTDFYFNFNGVTAHVMSDLIHMSFAKDAVQIVMGTQVSK